MESQDLPAIFIYNSHSRNQSVFLSTTDLVYNVADIFVLALVAEDFTEPGIASYFFYLTKFPSVFF